nr:hypothetical protein [Sodalis-like endosymbiont of Proechinophthirus fluctus]
MSHTDRIAQRGVSGPRDKRDSSKIHWFGKALMMPISVIATAGIFLGLVAAM